MCVVKPLPGLPPTCLARIQIGFSEQENVWALKIEFERGTLKWTTEKHIDVKGYG
jgi:hypothetical protein